MKQLISFLLRHVPRKYLQRVSHYVLRIVALFYRGNNVNCPICASSFRKFLPYGRVGRSNALCPSCLSLERHRLIWLYLKNETSFFTEPARMLHVAPEHCFIDRFESMDHIEYISGDIESPLAKVKMDIHEIPFDDHSFDIVFCNHVLEHVRDDRLALSEIFRVMRPGAWAILLIPLYYPLPDQTLEDPSVTDPRERERLYHQDDHVRKYGKDYRDRFAESGLVLEPNYVDELKEADLKRYALWKDEVLIVAKKPA